MKVLESRSEEAKLCIEVAVKVEVFGVSVL